MNPIEVLLFAFVVLFALGIGVVIPVLLELRRTLQAFRDRLDQTTTRFVRSLDEIDKTTSHVNHFADQLIENEREGVGLVAASRDASEALRSLSQALRKASAIGMAVGPAVVAFLTTLREMNASAADEPRSDDDDTDRSPTPETTRSPEPSDARAEGNLGGVAQGGQLDAPNEASVTSEAARS